MKDVSQEILDKELSRENEPLEIYHFWRTSQNWRYTSADTKIVFGGNAYEPAAISRSGVSYNDNLEVSTLSITAEYALGPLVLYIGGYPLETIWVQVMRIFRDYPDEASVIFYGTVGSTKLVGVKAQAQCLGIENVLKQQIPKPRYQPQCNRTLYDDMCTALKADFVVVASVTAISSDGRTIVLSGVGFEAKDDDWFTFGYVLLGDEKRLIVDHVKDDKTIEIRYPLVELEVGNNVSVYAGCDLKPETCRDKFDNLINFFGFPYIPKENPCLRKT